MRKRGQTSRASGRLHCRQVFMLKTGVRLVLYVRGGVRQAIMVQVDSTKKSRLYIE